MTLEQRVAALEAQLAEHRRALEMLFTLPAVKMLRLQLGDLGARVKLEVAPQEQTGTIETKVHPADAALKAGDRLAQLAARNLGDGMAKKA